MNNGLQAIIKNNNALNMEYDKDEIGDGFQLRFVGKSYAKYIKELDTETMLVPDTAWNEREENKNSENVFITGDNLEALKHLQKAYTNKIKLIYIDPPYNTGSDDFVYKDNFKFTDKELEEKLGLSSEEIERVKSLKGKSSHSAWLTFIYPRLALAKRLLTEDGVIFISIDDNEQANLKLICDEIFGEGNFIANFIVIRSEGGGLAKNAVIGHDYLLAYTKNILKYTPLGKPKDIRGQIIEKNGEQYWIETDWLREEFGKYGTCSYEDILNFYDQKKKDEIDEGIIKGDYILIPKENKNIVGRYRKIADDTSKLYTIVKHLNKNGVHDLKQLNLENIFNYPKSVSLLKDFILSATILNKNCDDIILDFFAGSATTAHAVMQLNKEDGGNRKYIMVQLDEPVKENSEAQKQGYKTIDEISRQRIKNAAKKLEDSSGFKHYKIASVSDTKILAKIEEFNPNKPLLWDSDKLSLDDFSGKSLNTDLAATGKDTLLATWLIADGFAFNTPIQELHIKDYVAYSPDAYRSLYFINEGWNSGHTKEFLNMIGKRKQRVNTIYLYNHSFDFTNLTELKNNLKSVLDVEKQINIIERF